MSGRIPQSFVDELLSRVDIVDFIQKRVPLKKAGKNWQACCPFHDEKTPSFSVNGQKQFFYCFGCQKGGNVIGFAMDYEGLNFPEAVEMLAKDQGLEVPHEGGDRPDPNAGQRKAVLEKLAIADRFYRQQLRGSKPAIDYLKQRGLSGEIARDYGLGVAPAGWDNLIKQTDNSKETMKLLELAGLVIHNPDKDSWYDRFRDRIMFPIRDARGRTIAFGGRVLTDEKPKYLNSPETPVFHKSRELYGLYEMLQCREKFDMAVVVEGYMDVIALAQYGLHNAVATLGTSIGPPHLEKLFRHVSEVVFCFDGDEAGERAAQRAFETSLPLMIDGRQVRFLFLPAGEDPDSMVRKEGTQAFTERLKNAMPLSAYLLKTAGLSPAPESPDERARAHSQAKPLLNTLPKGAFKELMEGEVSRLTGVSQAAGQPQAEAQDTAEAPPAAAPARPPAPKRQSRSGVIPHLIELLLQYPALATSIDSQHFPDPNAEDGDQLLLANLVNYLKKQPDADISAIDGVWRARYPEQSARLAQLAGRNLTTDLDQQKAALELDQVLQRWTRQKRLVQVQESIRSLDSIPWQQLSSDQKSDKRALMEEMRMLKDLLSR